MSFRLSRPASTGRAEADPAGADPAETGPEDTTPADSEPVAAITAEVPAPRGAYIALAGPPDDTSLDGPLLPDAAQLRGNWQQAQASFVDDPRGSVAEAAALVDHAAQALAGALQQRQRRLRDSWDTADGATDGTPLDTEELRVAMQRYRTMFNYICRP